jgi:hypothetical protein
MQITADIRRMDLAKFNIYCLPRLRANWIFVGIVAVGVFVYTLATTFPTNVIALLGVAAVSFVVGVSALLAGFVVSFIWILSTSTEKSGTLGTHIYSLSEQGLHEITKHNDALHKWTGIQSVEKSGTYIFIRINGYLFHLIPRCAFSSDKEYEEFWSKAHGYWKQAA